MVQYLRTLVAVAVMSAVTWSLGAQPVRAQPVPGDGTRANDGPPPDGTGDAASDNTSLDARAATTGSTADHEALPVWYNGTSAPTRERAGALFEAGNALYDRWRQTSDRALLTEAAARFEEAQDLWAHPRIQLNLARMLILLQREDVAYAPLEQAMRFGPIAMSESDHQWATENLARLARWLVVVDVRCVQPDVQVSLDGQALFKSPGVVKQHLLPGKHMLVANKPDHLTETLALNLEPGTSKTVLFALVSLADTTVSHYRWDIWKPWVVVGAGAGVMATGALLRRRAGVDFARFDRDFTAACPDGCTQTPDSALEDLQSRAIWENRIGLSTLFVGGIAVVSGTVWALLNRPQSVTVHDSGILVAPILSARQRGVVASWFF